MQESGTYQIMRKVNDTVTDNSIKIKGPKNQIGWGYTIASDFFSYLYGINWNDFVTEQGNLWGTDRLNYYTRGGYKISFQEGN